MSHLREIISNIREATHRALLLRSVFVVAFAHCDKLT
jgi:hypothetical protein